MTRPRRRMIGRPLPVFGMTDHDEMTGCSAWDDWARREAIRRAIVEQLPGILDQAVCVHGGDPDGPGAGAAAGAMLARAVRERRRGLR